MRAKSFLYVALGLFLLAAAFQLGVRSADAESSTTIHALSSQHHNSSMWVMDSTGQLHYWHPGTWFQLEDPLPEAGMPQFILDRGPNEVRLIYPNGHVWEWSRNAGTDETAWNYITTIPLEGLVSVQKSSMGAVKSNYR